MSKRGPGRPPVTEAKRLRQAMEARRMVDEELAKTPMPSQTEANDRAARRLRITTRTLRSRLAVVPADPPIGQPTLGVIVNCLATPLAVPAPTIGQPTLGVTRRER
jgi:hypothetical protein